MSETKMEPYARATKIWVLALASVASLMAALDAMVVTTALGTIRIDLGASMEALQWTVNAYTLTFAVLLRLATGWAGGACLQRASAYSSRRPSPARWQPMLAGSSRRGLGRALGPRS